MIQQWYGPQHYSEWLRRTFSILNIAIVVVTAIVVFSEFRFDWIERLVGSYLVSTNDLRPETGAIWETGKHTSNAQESLNQIISRKKDSRQTVDAATTFSNLASRLLPGDWVSLEKHQFKTLYLALDRSVALKVIDPAHLLWILNGSSLDRIFCEGIPGGIKIYFIDNENRVIKHIELKSQDVLEIENGMDLSNGDLSNIEGFRGRVYPAKLFFDAILKLPSDMVPDLMLNPEILLKQNGKLTKIGIWNESENGYIKLGFEFEEAEGRKIIFIKGREWAVWQLSLNLKGDVN